MDARHLPSTPSTSSDAQWSLERRHNDALSRPRPADKNQTRCVPTQAPVKKELNFMDFAMAKMGSATWIKEARQAQTSFYFDRDSEWDVFRRKFPSACILLLKGWCPCFENGGYCFNNSELLSLKRFIGFAVFGPPKEVGNEKNEWTGYKKKCLKKINDIYANIVDFQQEEVSVSSIIVIVKRKNVEKTINFPVFRIPKPSSSIGEEIFWFVDYEGRVYKGWEKFLEDNLLPAGECCYPKHGVYTRDSAGELDLCFAYTPASKWWKKAVKGADIAVNVGSVMGAAAGAGAIMLPMTALAAPVLVASGVIVATGSLYGLVRSSVSLEDRRLHRQSRSVIDGEARKHWLGIAESVVGMAAGGATTYLSKLAMTGQTLPKIGLSITDGLRGTSLIINGVEKVDSFITLKNKPEVTPLDIFQFSSVILFSGLAVMNMRTAKQLYECEQGKVSGLLSVMFDKNKSATKTVNIVDRISQGRGINHICDVDDFCSVIKSLLRTGPNVFSSVTSTINKLSISSCVSVIGAVAARVYDVFNSILSYLASILENVTHVVDETALFQFMDLLCSTIPGGQYIKKVVRIVADWKSWRTPMDLVKVCNQTWELFYEVYDKYVRNLFKPDQENAIRTVPHEISEENMKEVNRNTQLEISEENIKEVLEDLGIKNILQELGDHELGKKEIYHFPDHLSWSKTGILTEDDYLSIAKNVFGVSCVGANIIMRHTSACVVLEGVGIVFISSKYEEKIIIIQKSLRSFQG